MKFSNMHTHTVFDDGEDDVETMCRAAYEKKLCAIGFSAHAPITKKTGIESWWNLKDDLVDEYVEQILSAKNRWKGKLEVFLGFEVDYIKGIRSAIDSDIKAINPDYLIGSVHYVIPENGSGIFTVDGSIEEFERGVKEGFNGDVQALMHYYYNTVAEMIALGGFEILGHADLIKKNCQDERYNTAGQALHPPPTAAFCGKPQDIKPFDSSLARPCPCKHVHGLAPFGNKNYWPKESEACRQREIARAAADAGLTVEVNTGGINRGKIRDVYPSLSFLRLFNEYNVPAIITADAHRAADIDGNYETAIHTLSNAGYKEHVIFLKNLVDNYIFQTENIIIL